MVREQGRLKRRVAFPIVCVRIHDDALHRCRRIVALCVPAVVLRNDDGAAVRVKQQLGWIKPKPCPGSKGP